MAEEIDVSKLSPLSPEIIINQSTINIGTIGHVAHGKSTVVRAISGVTTIRWKKELERNITIRLGYANAKIYKCPTCPAPQCYTSKDSQIIPDAKCPHCGAPLSLIRHVSFVDCPVSQGKCGHEFHTHCLEQWLPKKRICPLCNLLNGKMLKDVV